MALQDHSSPGVEFHAFPLQPQALGDGAGGVDAAEAEAALHVDDSMPRQQPRWRGVQRISDESRVSRQTRERRDLSVGCDPAARNAAHHRMDAGVGVRARLGHDCSSGDVRAHTVVSQL